MEKKIQFINLNFLAQLCRVPRPSGPLGVCCNPSPVVVPVRTTPEPIVTQPPVTQPPVTQPPATRPTTRPPATTTERELTPEEEEIAFWDFRESIPGDPEIDYPILDKIPQTAFTCEGKLNGTVQYFLLFIKRDINDFYLHFKDTTPMSRRGAKCSTFAPNCPTRSRSKIHFCAQTERFSARNTFLANGKTKENSLNLIHF